LETKSKVKETTIINKIQTEMNERETTTFDKFTTAMKSIIQEENDSLYKTQNDICLLLADLQSKNNNNTNKLDASLEYEESDAKRHCHINRQPSGKDDNQDVIPPTTMRTATPLARKVHRLSGKVPVSQLSYN
jgi:hypothetical protein